MTLRLELLHKHWDTIGDLHAATDTYPWFRKGGREKVEADSLGSFLWKPMPWSPPAIDRGAIFDRFASTDAWETFQETGNCVVPAFTWQTSDLQLMDRISVEFDMYHHHQCRDDSGWLRNCYHSVLQQAVRQDPVYYALVVAARSDGVFRLLTYPHYAK
jgi:hypothetical protein